MLLIILNILKIIGIILLSILGLVLLVLLLVLFVPIRYRILVDKPSSDSNDIYLRAKVTYLLHLARFKISYPETQETSFKILFFTLYPKKEKKVKVKKQKDKQNKKKEDQKEDNKNVNIQIDNKESSTESVVFVSEAEVSSTQSLSTKPGISEHSTKQEEQKEIHEEICDKIHEDVREEIPKDKHEDIKEDYNTKNNSKNDKKSFIKRIEELVSSIYNRIKTTIFNVNKNITGIKDNIDYYIDVINSKAFKKSYSLCKKELKHLFRLIKPKHIRGHFIFGASEPSLTAKIFGLYSVLYPYLGKKFIFTPDLQNEKCEGQIILKGYTCVASILLIGIKLYFSKDIKRTLKLFKKETN